MHCVSESRRSPYERDSFTERRIMEEVLFFFAALGALGGAIGVVAMRNPFYGVLALIVHLFSLAVLFLMLSAAFVAAAPAGVYGGAGVGLSVLFVAYVGGGESA